jgi:hypothetical protein
VEDPGKMWKNLIKRRLGVKTPSAENASSAEGGSTATVVKPAWVNSLQKKDIPARVILKQKVVPKIDCALELIIGS